MAKNFSCRARYSRPGPRVQLERRAAYAIKRVPEPHAEAQQAAKVLKFAKGDNDGVGEFLSGLGSAGRTIRSISEAVSQHRQKKTGRRSESTARKLLEAFGFEVVRPADDLDDSDNEVARALAAAREFLKQAGYTVANSDPSESSVIEVPQAGSSTPSNVVEINAGGIRRKFAKNHPIVTKKKILTPRSSNVYWFLYDVDSLSLYVKFDNPKSEQNPTKRPGPLYRYSGVPASVFLAMLKAGSKGGFVWDNLRVRGTVSGHQYDYLLTSVREGYVPRKATLMEGGEMYVERTIRTRNKQGKSKVLRSKPTSPKGAPNRGEPNRGKPNRGRP